MRHDESGISDLGRFVPLRSVRWLRFKGIAGKSRIGSCLIRPMGLELWMSGSSPRPPMTAITATVQWSETEPPADGFDVP